MLLHFDGFVLDNDRRELRREGRPIAVQPQVFDLLAFLIANRSRVVTKGQIIEAVWGGRAISELTLTSRVNALRYAIGDTGEAQRLIRTVARKGLRFAGDVMETGAAIGSDPTLVADATPAPASPVEPPRLSIVVLPFANLSGIPGHEPFVDGLTESLTTDISRIRGSFVAARHSAFAYKGKTIDLKQVCRELGVRYALEGSVLRHGERMRINAQLIDAESGAHLWADRFDKSVADLFATQDEIVGRLAGQLNAALESAEARRAERSPQPSSMDFYFRGKACLNMSYDPVGLVRARGFFSDALRIDPDNVDALVWRAFVDAQTSCSAASTEDGSSRLAAAERDVTKALSLAPANAYAHTMFGFVLGLTNRVERAMEESLFAVELDPNLPLVYALMGLHALHLRRGEETEGFIREALRRSPLDPLAFQWFAAVGFAKNSLGRYEEAVNWLRQSVSRIGTFAMARFHLCSALSHLGRIEEARTAAAAGLEIDPTFTLERFRGPLITNDPYFLAWRERIAAGMRMAGIPEGAPAGEGTAATA